MRIDLGLGYRVRARMAVRVGAGVRYVAGHLPAATAPLAAPGVLKAGERGQGRARACAVELEARRGGGSLALLASPHRLGSAKGSGSGKG